MRALFFFAGACVALGLASTASAQITAGPDGFGYVASPIPFNFLDISTTGTPISGNIAGGGGGTQGNLDDGGEVVLVGFSFELYGTSPGAPGPTTIGICTNGYLADDPDLQDFTNDCAIANPTAPNRGIYPFWDDLSMDPALGQHGEIYYQTLGVAPVRRFIVQWDDMGTFDDSTASLTFQAHLLETDPATGEASTVEFHYGTLTDGTAFGFDASGGSTTIGLEADGGTDGLSIFCNQTGAVAAGDAYGINRAFPRLFAPPTANPGDVFTVDMTADPNVLGFIAFSQSNGPIGPFPFLGGLSFELGFTFQIIGSGFTDTTTGMLSSNPQTVPLMGATCFQGFFDGLTIGSFGPLGNFEGTNGASTVIVDPLSLTGDIPGMGMGDHYTFSGTAGDVVTIELCRTDNGGGMGTLDPCLCLLDPTGVTEAQDDDGGGDPGCDVPGPFGSSLIGGHVLQTTGTYTIIAGSYQGLGGEIGTYRLEVTGCSGGAQIVPALFADNSFSCPTGCP